MTVRGVNRLCVVGAGAGRQLWLPLTDGELACTHESAQAIRCTLSTPGL